MLDALRDLLLAEIPKEFCTTLSVSQEKLYKEAADRAYQDQGWMKPEGESVEPIVRRALFENAMRTAACDCGLQAINMPHAGGNYSYVLVRAGRVVITAHHVSAPKVFVQPCVSRQQNAAVNRWLDTLLPDGFLDLPSLADAKSINAYILHGMQKEERARSGLLERVGASRIDAGEAERQTLEFLGGHLRPNSSPMCGNSICQDRRFLAREMPRLEAFFHYRNLDVSTLKILAGLWAPRVLAGVVKSSTHLAMADIHDSIAELRHYRANFLRQDGDSGAG